MADSPTAGKGLEELIGRAVIDADFRKRLLAEPEQTIRMEGFTVDQEVMDTLKGIDPAAAEAAARSLDQAFAERRAAAA